MNSTDYAITSCKHCGGIKRTDFELRGNAWFIVDTTDIVPSHKRCHHRSWDEAGWNIIHIGEDMAYERMKYPQDRRDWVKAADARLPGLIRDAITAQNEARHMFEYFNMFSLARRATMPATQRIVSDLYREAHRRLLQVLYYQGMRAANLDKDE